MISMVIHMKKILISMCCSIFLGFLMGSYIFHEYDSKVQIKSTFSEQKETVYFLQLGVYSDIEKVKQQAEIFHNYIYTEENDKYHVYVGMTLNKKNAEKIKELLEKKGYTIYVKDMILTEKTFIDQLKQYDLVLEKTTEEEAIFKVLEKILNAYKDGVIDGSQDQRTTKK